VIAGFALQEFGAVVTTGAGVGVAIGVSLVVGLCVGVGEGVASTAKEGAASENAIAVLAAVATSEREINDIYLKIDCAAFRA
jgi:hypothetical protein